MNNNLKILFLDDSLLDVSLLIKILHKEGFEFDPQIATDKDEFLNAISNSPFDIILADHSMPQFDSLEALQFVKERNLSSSFIVVSGAVSDLFGEGIIRAGADGYVLKNNIKELSAAIKKAIEKKTNSPESKMD